MLDRFVVKGKRLME